MQVSSSAAAQASILVVHYGEIGLKGRNQIDFEKRLKANMQLVLERIRLTQARVKRMRGRLVVDIKELTPAERIAVVVALKRVPGVENLRYGLVVPQELSAIQEAALKLMASLEFETFRVSAKRADKNFPLTSPEINRKVGAFLVENLGKRVRLKGADVDCRVELVQRQALVLVSKEAGPGGLPVGASGKVVVLLSGGIDSPVAAYLALKRGAEILALHFHAVPLMSRASQDKARDLVRHLRNFHPQIPLYFSPLAPIQQAIIAEADPRYRIVLYRRFMFRIAEALARQEGAEALVTGESLGQVASQTLANMAAIEEVTTLPVLRPLVGMDKKEIVALAQSLGTYEISIQPGDDCCSLLVPPNPVTRAQLETARREESRFDVAGLVAQAVAATQVQDI